MPSVWIAKTESFGDLTISGTWFGCWRTDMTKPVSLKDHACTLLSSFLLLEMGPAQAVVLLQPQLTRKSFCSASPLSSLWKFFSGSARLRKSRQGLLAQELGLELLAHPASMQSCVSTLTLKRKVVSLISLSLSLSLVFLFCFGYFDFLFTASPTVYYCSHH